MLKHRQYIHFKRKILSEINKATGKFLFSSTYWTKLVDGVESYFTIMEMV